MQLFFEGERLAYQSPPHFTPPQAQVVQGSPIGLLQLRMGC